MFYGVFVVCYNIQYTKKSDPLDSVRFGLLFYRSFSGACVGVVEAGVMRDLSASILFKTRWHVVRIELHVLGRFDGCLGHFSALCACFIIFGETPYY